MPSYVYALGSNGSGQLGIGHKEDVSVPKPILCPTDVLPTKVTAGGNHTLFFTKDCQVHWAGDHTTGACGMTQETGLQRWRKMRFTNEGNAPVGDLAPNLITATWEATVVVAKDRFSKNTRVFSFGVGQKGELGLGQLIIRTPSATQIKDFPPEGTEIASLASGMGHVVAVLDTGEAYGWGNGRKGQLGAPGEIVQAPRKIEGVDFKIARAVCGREFTCFFGEPDSGQIQVLGSDNGGVKSGTPPKAPAWKDVGASWGGIYILGQDGTLTGWGRDNHGQLPPPGLPKLTRIAVGSEHVVATSETGEVIAWGWGEHGNCGPQVENGDVRGRWNTITSKKYLPSHFKIRGIGAGCATSWVFITDEDSHPDLD